MACSLLTLSSCKNYFNLWRFFSGYSFVLFSIIYCVSSFPSYLVNILLCSSCVFYSGLLFRYSSYFTFTFVIWLFIFNHLSSISLVFNRCFKNLESSVFKFIFYSLILHIFNVPAFFFFVNETIV